MFFSEPQVSFFKETKLQIKEFWVNRQQFRDIKAVTIEAPPIAAGEVRVAVDRCALTANNISYAVSGDAIGYWGYFPASEGWGKIPVWGFADVVESQCDTVPVGERIWGFFPMASHLTLAPGKVTMADFIDFAPHRSELPALYNKYQRTAAEPPMLRGFEDERSLFFPLFATSWILYDYLIDNDFFGAQQVVIGSVSSKTAFGLACMLHGDKKISQKVVGLTSPRNVDFVKSLGCCDQVLTYDNIAAIDSDLRTAFVDMSGNPQVLASVHRHVGENVVESCKVGATHWEESGVLSTEADLSAPASDLPGVKPRFFFAPKHFGKREKEWGPGSVLMKAFGGAMKVVGEIKQKVKIEQVSGDDAIIGRYLEVLNNQLPPDTGLIISVRV